MRAWLLVVGLMTAIALSAEPVRAGVPSAAFSYVDPCMVLCPNGDLPFTVIVRDLANNNLNGVSVVLDFSASPGTFICPAVPGDPYLVNPLAMTLRMFTGADGRVTFPARVGGTGPDVKVFANGVLIAVRALASPDQDGNGIVDPGIDGALFAAKLGHFDPTADYDCSVTNNDAADQAIQTAHRNHACSGIVVPTRTTTWGTLKLHYR
ncbi:MAG: hypothetical protein ABL977_04310 [Candidatus Eisenbacteria bacterium]